MGKKFAYTWMTFMQLTNQWKTQDPDRGMWFQVTSTRLLLLISSVPVFAGIISHSWILEMHGLSQEKQKTKHIQSKATTTK